MLGKQGERRLEVVDVLSGNEEHRTSGEAMWKSKRAEVMTWRNWKKSVGFGAYTRGGYTLMCGGMWTF